MTSRALRHWFQNLAKEEGRRVHFRGALYGRREFRYEVWSGLNVRFDYQHGEASDGGATSRLTIGLLFLTISLVFALPERWYFHRKCIATWENNREFYLVDGRKFGFYFHDWAFVAYWNKEANSGKTDIYSHIDELFLGKKKYTERKLLSAENVKFQIGGKEFIMNSIEWESRNWFRGFIPFALYNREVLYVSMKIDKPPMRTGKGENSWDLDDDGIFGMSRCWNHERPSWSNCEAMKKLAIEEYVKECLKDAKRYGSSSGERGVSWEDAWSYED